MTHVPSEESDPFPHEDSGSDGKPWDEQRWEAFLREGDRHTDEYMALFDMFGDEPNGHNIIAGAMGWEHLKTHCGQPPSEERCANCDERDACPFHAADKEYPVGHAVSFDTPEIDALFDEDAAPVAGDDVMEHPLVREAADVAFEAYQLLGDSSPKHIAEPAGRLRRHLTASCGQLAAGLGDDEFDLDVLGLSIAYLKRAHKALCLALGALSELRQGLPEQSGSLSALRGRIEALRDRVAVQIQHFRCTFRNGTSPA